MVYRKSSPSEAELSDSSAASSSSLGRSLEVWSLAKKAKSSNREGADRPVPLDRENAIDSEVRTHLQAEIKQTIEGSNDQGLWPIGKSARIANRCVPRGFFFCHWWK